MNMLPPVVLFLLLITGCTCLTCDNNIDMIMSGLATPMTLMQELGQLYVANRISVLGRIRVSFTYNSVQTVAIWDRLLKRSVDKKTSHMGFTGSPGVDVTSVCPIVSLPLMISYMGVTFNLPDVDRLNLTIPIVADMYMGNISSWNDSRIQALNPGLNMTFANIIPVGRYEQSVDVADFTAVLTEFSPEWSRLYGTFDVPKFANDICCNSSTWPPAVWLFGSRVAGLIGVVSSIPYTIGFASAVNLAANNMSLASLDALADKSAGNFLYPTAQSAQKAIEYWFDKQPLSKSDNAGARSTDAYPIAAFYELSFVDFTNNLSMDCCVAREMVGYAEFVLSDFGQNLVGNKYFLVPLPEMVKVRVRQLLRNLSCGGENLYRAYLDTLKSNNIGNPTQTNLIVGVTVGLCVVAAVTAVIFYYRWRRAFMRRLDAIIIEFKNLKNPIKEVRSFSNRSVVTLNKSDSMTVKTDSNVKTFLLGEVTVLSHKISGVEVDHLSRKCRLQLLKFREEIRHENLLPFSGLASLSPSECLLISEFAGGTQLHEFLQADKYELSDDIRFNLISDVVGGMKFLHSRQIAHNFLSSNSCYLDRSWRVRVGQWQICRLLTLENPKSLENLVSFRGELNDLDSLIRLLYVDPMAIHAGLNDTFSHLADVFSFAYLLYEIFTRQLPFEIELESRGETFEDFLQRKLVGTTPLTLEIPSQMPTAIAQLIRRCQAESRLERPTFKQIEVELDNGNCRAKKGVVDTLMDAVESYMSGLENAVVSRTAAAQDINVRLTAILSEVLPAGISTRLLQGEEVQPESFDCVSVLFSAIDNFDGIVAVSTPLEVMKLLNDLWVAFDQTISHFDAHKMDTINEIYMICSGLPYKNGVQHVKIVSDLAFALIKVAQRFEIRHLPEVQFKIQLGIHSGPVTAGIVGTKMPQYCVFGDTVNTASRMESSSAPMQIQVSEATQILLVQNFPQFQLDYRGEIEVKGKGRMKTYWLSESNTRIASLQPINIVL